MYISFMYLNNEINKVHAYISFMYLNNYMYLEIRNVSRNLLISNKS